jgi:hypothetical protein
MLINEAKTLDPGLRRDDNFKDNSTTNVITCM